MRSVICLSFLAIATAACGTEVKPTRAMVEVYSNFAEDLASLKVEASDEEDRERRKTEVIPLDTKRVSDPNNPDFLLSFAIAPSPGGDQHRFRVEVVGLDKDDNELVRARAASRFVRGDYVKVPVYLLRACAGVVCTDPSETCSDEILDANGKGQCVPLENEDSETTDGAQLPDASTDARATDGGSERGTGPTVDAMLEDARAAAAADHDSAASVPDRGSSTEEAGAGPMNVVPGSQDSSVEPGESVQGEDAGGSGMFDAGMPCIASAEVCDGKDNDCDGVVDEEKQAWYCDADGDGFAANASGRMDACDAPAASASCSAWTTTAPLGIDTRDCDDATALRAPGAGFGLSVGSSGDLNCDGETETKLEFVESSIPGFYSSTTPFNLCEHFIDEVFSGNADGECECWLSTSIAFRGFIRFENGAAVFEQSGDLGGGPYFMRTFPCAEDSTAAIFLIHARRFGSECMQEGGMVAVRQLCR